MCNTISFEKLFTQKPVSSALLPYLSGKGCLSLSAVSKSLNKLICNNPLATLKIAKSICKTFSVYVSTEELRSIEVNGRIEFVKQKILGVYKFVFDEERKSAPPKMLGLNLGSFALMSSLVLDSHNLQSLLDLGCSVDPNCFSQSEELASHFLNSQLIMSCKHVVIDLVSFEPEWVERVSVELINDPEVVIAAAKKNYDILGKWEFTSTVLSDWKSSLKLIGEVPEAILYVSTKIRHGKDFQSNESVMNLDVNSIECYNVEFYLEAVAVNPVSILYFPDQFRKDESFLSKAHEVNPNVKPYIESFEVGKYDLQEGSEDNLENSADEYQKYIDMIDN